MTPVGWEMTPKGLRSVKDRMSAELEKEGSAIMTEIMSGELGEEALENRLRRCVELQDEIVVNEEILGEFGDRLSAALSIAQQAATQGMMIV